MKCIYACTCMYTREFESLLMPWCMCGSQRQMHEGTFSFLHVGSGDEIQLLV